MYTPTIEIMTKNLVKISNFMSPELINIQPNQYSNIRTYIGYKYILVVVCVLFSFQSAEGEDDEETLSADACGSSVKYVRNDLSDANMSKNSTLENSEPSSSAAYVGSYDVNYQHIKDTYSDVASSSKIYNVGDDVSNTSTNDTLLYSSEVSNLQSEEFKSKTNNGLKNVRKMYNDSSGSKNNNQSGSGRFITTLVSEELLEGNTSSEPKYSTIEPAELTRLVGPLVVKAKVGNVTPGFTIDED